MKKRYLLLLLSLLIVGLTGTSYAWQGRMGGMEDPYGLVADESDYLIHPAKIVKGEGVRFYGDYRFTYTGVMDWDNQVDVFTPAGVLFESFPRETSGDQLRHEALIGSSFPLGPGRMGLFFTYTGMREDYDGKDTCFDPVPLLFHDTYNLRSNFDDFVFRLLYGLPIGGGFKLGAEANIAYRQEENKALYNEDNVAFFLLYQNYPFGGIEDYSNTFPFMLPYNSSYWEALFKGSLDGKIGPLDIEFSLRGGFLFAGDNQYEFEVQNPIGTPVARFDIKGDLTGWRIGGDLWLRYPLAKALSLPFLVRVDYQDKTRDGDGPGLLGLAGINYSYKSQEQNLGITVGGGLDKELAKGARIAVGIYYNYLQGNNDFWLLEYAFIPGVGNVVFNDDYNGYPASKEHQIMLRLAGELELSPIITLRMGLTPFFGWVREAFKFSYTDSVIPANNYTDDVPIDGYHWGIGVSLGGTIKLKPITLEPFINGGWQQLHLKGNGDSVDNTGTIAPLYEMSKDRNKWSIGGGFSVLFNL
jgi:hypothetical protein